MSEGIPVVPATAPPKDRLAFLDVARAAATLIVLFEHAVGPFLPDYGAWSRAHGSLGRMGVALFLLISGFIIPVSLEKSGSNGRFWIRRVFRLFPAYWLSIAAAYAYLTFGGTVPLQVPKAETNTWLVNMTMLQRFFRVQDVWGVFWTLQLELVIYAACSVLFATRVMTRWTAILLTYFALYFVMAVAQPLLTGKPFSVGGDRFLYFTPLMGVVAQRYVVGAFSRRKAYGLLAGQVFTVVAVWGINYLLNPARVRVENLLEFLLLWGVAYLILFGLVERRRHSMPRVLCWFGRISYSVYLLHPLVLVVLQGWKWQALAFIPTLFAVSMLLADLSFRFVEKPGIAVGQWVENKLFGPPAKRT